VSDPINHVNVAWAGEFGSWENVWLTFARELDDGCWYCSVHGPGGFRFSSADADVLPKTERAARWLCELVVRANRGHAPVAQP
jgi:hypothetical protein